MSGVDTESGRPGEMNPCLWPGKPEHYQPARERGPRTCNDRYLPAAGKRLAKKQPNHTGQLPIVARMGLPPIGEHKALIGHRHAGEHVRAVGHAGRRARGLVQRLQTHQGRTRRRNPRMSRRWRSRTTAHAGTSAHQLARIVNVTV
jgi:hypothetical protein